jgi:hypothetical protein
VSPRYQDPHCGLAPYKRGHLRPRNTISSSSHITHRPSIRVMQCSAHPLYRSWTSLHSRSSISSAAGLSSWPSRSRTGCSLSQSRTASSKQWLSRQTTDHFAREAKVQGLKSRAAFKLLQINDKYHLFKPSMTVVDLGFAPGSWSQVETHPYTYRSPC